MKNTKEDTVDNLSECIKELESLVQTLDIYSYSINDGSVYDYGQRLKSITEKLKSQPSAPVEQLKAFFLFIQKEVPTYQVRHLKADNVIDAFLEQYAGQIKK